uniref:Uncharacterized protein n=1 Tax=Glossina palpalis gambiensis TaxID=67801 RepID=A0A1B0B8P3_9MUSC
MFSEEYQTLTGKLFLPKNNQQMHINLINSESSTLIQNMISLSDMFVIHNLPGKKLTKNKELWRVLDCGTRSPQPHFKILQQKDRRTAVQISIRTCNGNCKYYLAIYMQNISTLEHKYSIINIGYFVSTTREPTSANQQQIDSFSKPLKFANTTFDTFRLQLRIHCIWNMILNRANG